MTQCIDRRTVLQLWSVFESLVIDVLPELVGVLPRGIPREIPAAFPPSATLTEISVLA